MDVNRNFPLIFGFIFLMLFSCASIIERAVDIKPDVKKLVATCLSNNDAKKPDLIITSIHKKEGKSYYYYIKYMNIGAPSRGDFLISLSSARGQYPGNSYFRFPLPAPCLEKETGGITVGLVGVSETASVKLTAEIDWEKRVSESNEKNNFYTTIVKP